MSFNSKEKILFAQLICHRTQVRSLSLTDSCLVDLFDMTLVIEDTDDPMTLLTLMTIMSDDRGTR